MSWRLHRCANRIRRRFQPGSEKPRPEIVRPIFVVGASRSGTTLLAECLHQHPEVVYCLFEMSPQWRELAKIDLGHGVNRSAECPPLHER
ncbi:MAG: sulfotransferase, partial [Lentisphaerae bacterium]|nr:sulfotransferase [Lentisphaerota bacterium]